MDQEDYEDGILTIDDIQSVKDDLMFDQLTFDDSDYLTETEKLQDTCSNILDGIEFIEVRLKPLIMNLLTSKLKRGIRVYSLSIILFRCRCRFPYQLSPGTADLSVMSQSCIIISELI